eukprot:CAMPEP_0116897054 /NCGR_PEP_ID=MMETSP0467-20121206/6150_1 /TAXON_ID=283647 /ORGANISM="Mesodinium pulex, Strain SPMC105" /LENGTH=55 /DNA_ID=CAMNT_0004568545 /DNA_START=922 /DNA_END=1089 /DNA_ORIENTATION=+
MVIDPEKYRLKQELAEVKEMQYAKRFEYDKTMVEKPNNNNNNNNKKKDGNIRDID